MEKLTIFLHFNSISEPCCPRYSLLELEVPKNSCSFLMVHRYHPSKIVVLGIFYYKNVGFPSLQLSFHLFSDIGVHFQVMCNTWLLGVHLQGVLDAVRMSCVSYPTRCTFYEFLD